MAAGAADALGSALGIETAHQRELKAHARAMKKWRETVKDLRQQDAAAWEQLKARSAIAPLAQRRKMEPVAPQVQPTQKVAPQQWARPHPF